MLLDTRYWRLWLVLSSYISSFPSYPDFTGDYCDVADLVLEMRNYECHDITDKARQVSSEFPSAVRLHEGALYVMWYDPSY